MISFFESTPRRNQIVRREVLRIGGLGMLGVGLPAFQRGRKARASETNLTSADLPTFGRAKHCILLYMWGGPPHLDTFDMKPDAPVEIRGDFDPIATNVPGITISDHLPLLSRHADKFAIVRSVTHTNGDHISQCHDMLTGNAYPKVTPIITAARSDHPHFGAVVARLRSCRDGLPASVQLPCTLASNSGKIIPGQYAGFLGQKYDPYTIEASSNKLATDDPEYRNFNASEIQLPDSVTSARFQERRLLRDAIDQRPAQRQAASPQKGMENLYEQAFSLVTSPQVRQAFDLSSEDPTVRDRYGRSTFGQGVCMARRLVEAGVSVVTVYWQNGTPRADIGWDNHINNFHNLKNWQLPPTDRAFSALLEDLARTGKLDETLVVWMGEFGRSPRIDDNGGRDHWPACFSVVMAGGGVRGGQTYGSSDGQGAFPDSLPVTPLELGATIFHFLGIDPKTEIHDQFTGQPHPVCRGTPMTGMI